jgi:hypothetical protein
LGLTFAAQSHYAQALREFDLALRFASGDEAARIQRSKAQCFGALLGATLHFGPTLH